jgi:hypothetical protein
MGEKDQVSNEELEQQGGEQLPDREAMSLVDANMLSDDAVAYANATQDVDIDQSS